MASSNELITFIPLQSAVQLYQEERAVNGVPDRKWKPKHRIFKMPRVVSSPLSVHLPLNTYCLNYYINLRGFFLLDLQRL